MGQNGETGTGSLEHRSTPRVDSGLPVSKLRMPLPGENPIGLAALALGPFVFAALKNHEADAPAATYQLRLFLNHHIDGKLAAHDQYQQRVGFSSLPAHWTTWAPASSFGAGAASSQRLASPLVR